jgi:putative DNA primase/helicase
MSDPFAPISGKGAAPRAEPPAWEPIVPVPADAPPPPPEHPTRGKASAIWPYKDAEGRLLHIVRRFEEPGGGKVILPASFCRSPDGKRAEWRGRALDAPRPLYRLAELAARPDAPVVICEGEKAADAAAELLPDYVVTTSSGGSKAAGKADWRPLHGRRVVIWPDADEAGQAYAEAVAKRARAAGAASVEIITPPQGVADGWDAANALAEGWDQANASALAGAARPATAAARKASDETGGNEAEAGGRKRQPQRDQMLELLDGVELWHDASGEAYATFPINGHREHWQIRSREVRRWLALIHLEATGSTLGGQAFEDVLRVLEARAVHQGREYDTWRRVGRADGALFLDLGDRAWRAVKVTAAGWEIVDRPAVKLLRSPAMRPLPEPEAGGLIEELRGFVNVAAEEDFALIVAWLVAALRVGAPYPILVISGEQGSGKSGVSRLLRSLIDPNDAMIRGCPRDDRDLIVSAVNAHVLAFDNLSGVANWLADGMCRIATGSGYATRRLHTDRDEEVFSASRPIILNGIENLTQRADLADRAVSVHLPRIAEDRRRAEDEFQAAFDEAAPRILGALLDAVSAALCHLPDTKLPRAPRMADFAKWITAAESGLGWEPGAFLSAYDANREAIFDDALEADPVAVAIRDYVFGHADRAWEGKPSELLAALTDMVPEKTRKAKWWPGSASALGSKLRRAAPLLIRAGLVVDYGHSGERYIRLIAKDA